MCIAGTSSNTFKSLIICRFRKRYNDFKFLRKWFSYTRCSPWKYNYECKVYLNLLLFMNLLFFVPLSNGMAQGLALQGFILLSTSTNLDYRGVSLFSGADHKIDDIIWTISTKMSQIISHFFFVLRCCDFTTVLHTKVVIGEVENSKPHQLREEELFVSLIFFFFYLTTLFRES